MPAYLAPGVYLRPQRTATPEVRLVRTDVAGFLGFTERGPLALPETHRDGTKRRPDERALRLTSWEEYRAIYGGLIPHGLLPYAVRGFFENGGAVCYVMRVAAVSDERSAEHPRVARWIFPADAPLVAAGRLAQPASSRDTALHVDPAGGITRVLEERAGRGDHRAVAVTLWPADGGAPELHVLEGIEGTDRLSLASPIARQYPRGAAVQIHEAALEIEALSAGNWGNRIRLHVTPLQHGPGTTEFALRVIVDPGADSSHPREEEFYRALSVQRRDEARRPPETSADRVRRRNPHFAADLVNGRSRVIRVVHPTGDEDHGTQPLLASRTVLPENGVHLEGGQDGLRGLRAPAPGGVPLDWLLALSQLDAIDEIGILCAPDAVYQPSIRIPPPSPARPAPCAPPAAAGPPRDVVAEDATAAVDGLDAGATFQMYAAMLEQCERRHDRVAIIDPPVPLAQTVGGLLTWRNILASLPLSARRFAATYGPWLVALDPTQAPGSRRAIPPGGHVAGVYAQTDNAVGVQRPPANVELAGVVDVTDAFSTPDQEALNPRGVNLLRSFPGRGIRVWGARSLSDEPEWRFIHARRLMSMIQESVDRSMQWAVFEPNDDSLRRTIVHAVSVFLREIWQRGGLKGNVPAEGFFVRCDETNNPPSVIDAGQVVCQVGVAVAAPMEFIVFEIRQTPQGAEILES